MKTSFALFCALMISIAFSSCMTSSKALSLATYDVSKVPADFDPQKHILLVAEMPRLNNPSQRNNFVTKKLDAALKEKYPYKYEIVSLEDISDKEGKYSDTSTYKYALLNSLNSLRHSSTTTVTRTTSAGTFAHSVSPSARTTYIDFSFYDRTKEIRYPNTENASPRLGYVVAAFSELVKKAKS